ncbi:MAG TPA: hypothetical protein VH415_11215 [Nitrososphaeraceae archaeon]|jgi:Ca2+-binding RTX toxin-like protein
MVFRTSLGSLIVVVVVSVTLAMGLAMIGVSETFSTLVRPLPSGDLMVTTNNSNTTSISGENPDSIVLTPPETENTIDCGLRSSLLGGSGDCIGTHKNDKMLSGRHYSHVIASLGDDYLVGGNITDFLFGDNGTDFVNGGTGNDWIAGQNDEDKLFGGPGNDIIWGGQKQQYPLRNETEWPSSPDYIDCGPGYDTIYIDASDTHVNCESVNPIDPTQFLDPSISGANLTRDNP